VNSEADIQLSDDLRHLVAGHTFTGDPDALLRRGRQARRRSLATRGAAGVGVLAVAAGATVVGIDLGSGGGAPRVQDAAYVVSRVSATLATDSNQIYRITDPGQGTIQYEDLVTGDQYWVHGSGDTRTVAWDSSPVVDHHVHQLDTTVNHQDRTYSTADEQTPGYVSGPLPPETGIVSRIKESIGQGADQVVGAGDYQGHQVIKLDSTEGGMTFQLWVDATTYQPVHLITTVAGAQPDVQDLAFLPRTAENVKMVGQPQIPTGFTKVADALPAGTGHGG
jgi:hypothetical protein